MIVALDRRHRRARLVGARALTTRSSLRNRELALPDRRRRADRPRLRSRLHRAAGASSAGARSATRCFFFALYLAAHLVARRTVPNADPYLLPMAGLLTAVGLTEIYRLGAERRVQAGALDRDRRRAVRASRCSGCGATTACSSSTSTCSASARSCCSSCRASRASARPSTARGSGCTSARSSFQPGEFAKIFLIVFLAAYLREKREVLAQGRLKDVGPLLVIWGACMLVLVSSNDLGSGAPLLRDLPRDALHRDRAPLVRRSAGSCSSSPAASSPTTRIAHVHERVTIWLHPWTTHKVYCPPTGGLALRQDCESYQLVKSLYSIGNGGFGGAGLGKGTFTTTDGHAADPVREQRLHLLGARAGARPDRRRRAAARLHALRRARHEDRAAGRRRLLEAARRRPRRSASRCRRSSSSAASCGSSR